MTSIEKSERENLKFIYNSFMAYNREAVDDNRRQTTLFLYLYSSFNSFEIFN